MVLNEFNQMGQGLWQSGARGAYFPDTRWTGQCEVLAAELRVAL